MKQKPKKRKRGRPYNGRVTFARSLIKKLPETGSVSQFAKILGVSTMTIYRWVNEYGCEALIEQYSEYNYSHWTIHKDLLVAWLIESGRYRPRRKYE